MLHVLPLAFTAILTWFPLYFLGKSREELSFSESSIPFKSLFSYELFLQKRLWLMFCMILNIPLFLNNSYSFVLCKCKEVHQLIRNIYQSGINKALVWVYDFDQMILFHLKVILGKLMKSQAFSPNRNSVCSLREGVLYGIDIFQEMTKK